MIAQTTRAPWRTAWRLGTSDGLLAVLLLGVAVGLAATVWLPQMPSASPAAYAQWLSETQARFGRATPTMQTMGLFAITRSFGFRLLLSLLAGCSLLRLVRAVDRLRQNREIAQPSAEEEWHTLSGPRPPDVTAYLRSRRYRVLDASPLLQADRWPWADSFTILTHTGSLLLLLGLLLFHLWGWEVTGWVVQAGNKVTLPGTGKWVSLDSHAREIAHSPGIVTFVEKRGPGVRLSAVDDAGNPLTLQQTVEAPPATQSIPQPWTLHGSEAAPRYVSIERRTRFRNALGPTPMYCLKTRAK